MTGQTTAGTAGDRYRVEIPAPREPRRETADPAEPGARKAAQR